MRDASFGQWRVEAELGQGGMGVVYLARHAESGQRVALKSLRARPSSFDLKSLRFEIEVLSALRHPNIVSPRAHGVQGHIPWLAMELVSGRSLHTLLATRADATLQASTSATDADGGWSQTLNSMTALTRSPEPSWTEATRSPSSEPLARTPRPPTPTPRPTNRPSREELLGWIAQVCHALGYVHGEGFVHCDVKPGNVLVTEQGQAILLDFGLAAPFANRVAVEAMEKAGLLAGSASYISPEQIRGEELDARADLYAVGCILFEALMGRPPFVGTVEEKLEQHLSAAPPALGAGAPEPLRELIPRLLAKERDERPGHAQVLLHALGQAGAALDAAERPSLQPYLYRPRLAGRRDLLTQLKALLTPTSAGGVTILSGESGIGKTHLAMELIREARRRKQQVFVGYGARAGVGGEEVGGPLSVFSPILRQIADMCAQHGAAATRRVLGQDAAVLAPVAPFVAALPGVRPLPPVAELPPDAAQLRLFSALTRVLRRACGDRPVLFVLDDVQWADALSLGALEYLLGEIKALRGWTVVCTCRAEEAPGALLALGEQEGCELLAVPRLERDDVGQIMAQMLGQPPEKELVDAVAERAGGNAFFIAEYLRLAVDEGLLRLDASGRWGRAVAERGVRARLASLPAPGSILELITSRLAHLSEAQRRVCQAAAVLGRRVSLALLVEIVDTSPESLHPDLKGLQRGQIVEPDGEGHVRFMHDKLHEVAYASIDASARAPLHQRVGELLHAMEVGGERVDPGAQAWHWSQAGHPERARGYHLRAAQEAAARYAVEDARRQYDAALALFEPGAPEAIEARLDLAERILSDPNAVVREAQRVLDQLPTEDPPQRPAARAHVSLAQAFLKISQVDEARAHIHQALAFAEALGDRPLQVQAHELRAKTHFFKNDTAPAAEALNTALSLCDDDASRGRCRNSLGVVAYTTGEFTTAMEHFERALATFQALDDRPNASTSLTLMGNTHNRCGRSEEALRCYRQALDALEGLGNHFTEGRIFTNTGNAYMEMGHPERAVQAYEEALDRYARLVVAHAWRPVLGNLALALGTLGRLPEAVERAHEAVANGRAHPQRLGLASGLKILAWVELMRGDLDAATDALVEALASDRAGRDTFFKADSLACLGRVQRVRGELDAAEASFTEAIDLFRAIKQRKYEMTVQSELGRLRLQQRDLDAACDLLDACLANEAMPEDDRAEALVYRAAARRLQGRLDDAQRDLDEALARYDRAGYNLGRVQCASAQGLLAHQRGEDPARWLAEAERVFAEHGYLPDSEAAHALRELRAALAAPPLEIGE